MIGLLQAVRKEPQRNGAGVTSLGEALKTAGRLAGMSKFVVVVSDFRGPRDWRIPLLNLTGRHEVICVEIRDPREEDLPDVGELSLIDPESGRQLRVNTSKRKIRERFAAAAAADRAEVAGLIMQAGARHVVLSTSGDWLKPFIAALSQKGANR